MLDALHPHPWREVADGAAFAATLIPPDAAASRCALLVRGWDEEAAIGARARWGDRESAPDCAFLSLGGALAGCILDRPAEVVDGVPIRLRAPRPPETCGIVAIRHARVGVGGRASASVLPRCLFLPPAPPAPEAGDADLPARVAASLVAGRLAEALADCATVLLAGGDPAPAREAARLVLDHLARHPMARDPALGAFLGALLDT